MFLSSVRHLKPLVSNAITSLLIYGNTGVLPEPFMCSYPAPIRQERQHLDDFVLRQKSLQ